MNKKAQAEKIFIYALMVIIVGLMLIYGYKGIKGMVGQGEAVQFAQFKSEMETNFDAVRYRFGTVTQPIINVPMGYEIVCIGSTEGNYEGLSHKDVTDITIIKAELSSGASNVFLLKAGKPEKWIYVGKTWIASGDLLDCYPVQSGQIRLRLEGLGDKVNVSFIAVHTK